MSEAFVKELFESGAHIGYSRSKRHPKMSDFIFGTRNNIEIIDLESSEKKIVETEAFLHTIGKENKTIMIIGTKPNVKEEVKEIATSLNMPYVVERWLGGTLTNFKVLSGRVTYLLKLEEEEKTGGFEKYTKKEKLMKKKKLEKLKNMFEGLRNLKSLPDSIIMVDPKNEKTALSEAKKKNIPVVALLNVNSDPTGIQYPIPVNHNSQKTVALVLRRLKKAYEEGLKEKPAAIEQKNGLTFQPLTNYG